MSILFLNFYSNLEKGSKLKSNFYNTPLREQFQLLNDRLPLNKRFNSLRELVEKSFPSGFPKRYYITCPNFKREVITQRNGIEFLNNVVIRPEKTQIMTHYLPENINIILIGDIVSGNKLRAFQVKGIEFIDDNIANFDEMVIQSRSCYAFEKNVWSINHVDYLTTFFTPDVVNQLIEKYYTVKNPQEVIKMHSEWVKYLDFRYYYLNIQSQRFFEINNYEIKTSFMVDRKTYRKNTNMYDDFILDGHRLFTKSEQIIINRQIEGSESFPLLRVDIDRNKKVFYQEENFKGNRKRTEEEIRLFSFTRENLSLSKNSPLDGDSKSYDKQLRNSITLDSRYKIVKHEIEPDVFDIDQEYKLLVDKIFQDINNRYTEIKKRELTELLKLHHTKLSEDYDEQLNRYIEELSGNLESDIQFNKDKDIIQLVNKEIARRKSNIENEEKRVIKELEKRLNKEENKKEKEITKDMITQKKAHYNQEKETQVSLIDVESYYVKRNNQLIKEKRKLFDDNLKTKLEEYKFTKEKELVNKYQDEIERLKASEEYRLAKEKNEKIKNLIENETILRFSVYFKLDDENIKEVEKKLNLLKPSYLIYNNRAEKAKIDRQKNALEQFFSGYVKNPFLSTYLFSPSDLPSNNYSLEDWKWFLENLNEKQREAVKKAVSSNGLFLLQGPPGTGKTQVIAEIIGHFIQKGKRVLVSSETHKAIDNVFERMPKIADIRPIRLIPSQNNKETNYGPDKLVDNLYMNISERMNKTIESYENFYEYKETFSKQLDELKLLSHQVQSASLQSTHVEDMINKKEYDITKLTKRKESLINQKDDLEFEKDSFNRTIRYFERNCYEDDEDIKYNFIKTFLENIDEYLNDYETILRDNLPSLISSINQIELKTIKSEIDILQGDNKKLELETKKEEIRVLIKSCFDEFFEVIPGKEEQLKTLQKQLKNINHEINQDSSGIEFESLKLAKIFSISELNNKKLIQEIPGVIERIKKHISRFKEEQVELLFNKIQQTTDALQGLMEHIENYNQQIKALIIEIDELRNNQIYSEYKEYETRLSISVNEFFKTFNIVKDYRTNEEAIEIIESEWNDLEKNFESREKENKKKIPIFKKISKYLRNEDVIEADKVLYTKPLFDKVNLYGVTTSSRDNFNESSNEALSKYNLGNLDLKKQGIDVVIIDEVSKSSFLELLIPILYGKTVILVGDHRQLSPMYEYRNFRNDDFDGLDPEIIDPEINKKYTELYEETFFKTLFEHIAEDYKVRLTQQYRSHEHIMNVFNHFYNNTLELGESGQNKKKQHFLSIHSNSRTIIDPNKHIYFIDNKSFESREMESTSIQNKGEAEVVIELLKKIDATYSKNKDWNPKFDKSGKDERMSVGVICTYGDQTRLIKQKRKQQKLKFKNFNTKGDSKLIISTVDDFQGDERDIIIVTMVRNPENPGRSRADFIKQYQRINVAYSRARRLLIIVGNKNYLMNKGVIDLPDVDGRPEKDKIDFPVFREIIDTIERYGKVIDDTDIIGGQE